MNVHIENDKAARRLFAEAIALEDAGRLEEALSLREALIQYSPSEEGFILSIAQSLAGLDRFDGAEHWYRKSIFIHPYSELSSLQLFHFLLNADRIDDAFIEMKRFQSIAHSDDYAEFVRIINTDSDG